MLAFLRDDIPDGPTPRRPGAASAPTVGSLLDDLRVVTSRAMWAAAEASLTWAGGIDARRRVRSARRIAWELQEEARLADLPKAEAVAEQFELVARAAGRLATVRLTATPWVPATRIDGFRVDAARRLPALGLTEPAAVDAVLSCALAVDAAATALDGRPDMAEVAHTEADAARRAAHRFLGGAEGSEPGAAETLVATTTAVAEVVAALAGLEAWVPPRDPAVSR